MEPEFPPAVSPGLTFTVGVHEDGGDVEQDDLDHPVLSEVAPWERQKGETSKAFHAFCHYRDMRARSMRLAFVNHKSKCEGVEINPSSLQNAPRRWSIWAAAWGWVERASAFDADIDRQARDRLISDQVEARSRHARVSQATLSGLSVVPRVILEASRTQTWIQGLVDHALAGPGAGLQLLGALVRVSQVLPGVINAERLSLGLTTESVEVDDKRTGDPIANGIVADPASARMAIALLDRLAHAGEGAPERPGVPSEPEPVEAGPSPEPPDGETG